MTCVSQYIEIDSSLVSSINLNWKGLILALLVWLGTNLWKKGKSLHPVVWIALSAVVGIVFKFAGA